MLLANGIRMAQVYVYHRIQPFQRTQLKPLIAAASAALICWGAQEQLATADGLVSLLWGTVISCLIFLASYFVVLRLQGFEAEDRAMFAMLQRRIGRFRKVSAGDESSL